MPQPEEQAFNLEIQLDDWNLYFCNTYSEIYIHIIWLSIQITFVHIFVTINFGMPDGTIFASHPFLKKTKLLSSNSIFFEQNMPLKNIAS